MLGASTRGGWMYTNSFEGTLRSLSGLGASAAVEFECLDARRERGCRQAYLAPTQGIDEAACGFNNKLAVPRCGLQQLGS